MTHILLYNVEVFFKKNPLFFSSFPPTVVRDLSPGKGGWFVLYHRLY